MADVLRFGVRLQRSVLSQHVLHAIPLVVEAHHELVVVDGGPVGCAEKVHAVPHDSACAVVAVYVLCRQVHVELHITSRRRASATLAAPALGHARW